MKQSWSDELRAAWRQGLGEGRVRQHANESPWEIPRKIKAEIVETLADLPFGRYDFAVRPVLTEALASYSGVPADQIILGNGADELIQMCMIALPAAAGRVVVTRPTFFVYQLTAGALGREVVDVPLIRPDFRLDVAGLMNTVRPGDLVFICRPNNPTGNVFVAADVLAALDGLGERGATVVLDEAYYEFCGETLVDQITAARRSNLVILRTLSKAFRLAGLRLGYGLVDPALVEPLERARLTYNLSAASMVAAVGVLSEPDLARRTAAEIAGLRGDLAAGLADLPGVTVYPSQTNFIFVELSAPAAPVAAALSEAGILVRHFAGDETLARTLRISVGDERGNQMVVEALSRALAAGEPGAPVPGDE